VSAAIDGLVGLCGALAFSSTIGMYFARRAVVTLRIGEPGTWWTGPLPMVLGAVGEVVYVLPLACGCVWLVEPLTGATIGQRVTGVRAGSVDARPPSRSRLWLRHVLLAAGFWGWTAALVSGRWQIAAAGTLVSILVAGGMASALGAARASLLDRVSGTRVWASPSR